MTCFYPITAYRDNNGLIVFHDKGKYDPIKLPCNNCVGCRLERSRQWGVRCVHEAKMHAHNCFVTLTYNNDNIPSDSGLRVDDLQKFFKRLRHYKGKFRRFACGEYGTLGRPHYHAILFGIDFEDKYKVNINGKNPVYHSDELEKIWNKGFTSVGECTFETAAYTARYCLKKLNGKMLDNVDKKTGLKPYERFDSITGEIVQIKPEFAVMSRRPGIGFDWIHKFKNDVYDRGYYHVNGVRMSPTRYYDEYLKNNYPEEFDLVKAERNLKAFHSKENEPERLRQKEIYNRKRIEQIKRKLK